MKTAVIVLWLIAFGLSFAAWKKGDGSLKKGINKGWKTFKNNLLILIIAFLIVGFVEVLAPQNLIEQFLGPDSGWSGLILAEAIGMLMPGGPYAVFPIVGVIFAGGAGLGPMVTLISSYSLLALLTITFEIPFMGWRFTAVRWGIALFVPLLAGTVAMLI